MKGTGANRLALAATLLATTVAAEPGSVGRDAAARIDYGWFTGDEGMIRGAEDSLKNSLQGPWQDYLLAYAAYRKTQTRLDRGLDPADALEVCKAGTERAASESSLATEARILGAACALLGAGAEPLRAPVHQRRARQLLAEARDLDRDNPRLLLVALQYVDADRIGERPSGEQLLAAFRQQAAAGAFPDWGEVEALTLLAAASLEAGDGRGARDLIEEALLLAPEYAAARELRQRLAANRSNN